MSAYRRAAVAAVLVAGCAIALSPAGALAGAHRHTSHHVARRHRRARTVTFDAHVVRVSAKRLVVRTIAGRTLSFSARQIRHHVVKDKHARKHARRHGHRHSARAASAPVQVSSGPVVINILGLQPGVLVSITEVTGANGDITITITLPPASTPVSETVSGTLSDLGDSSLRITTSSGDDLRFEMSRDMLANLDLQRCDIVEVNYHQDAGILIADGVTQTGTSTTGDCAPTYDAIGVITSVSNFGVAISGSGGPLSFNVDPSSGLTDGFLPGDLVDVTYTRNADGSLSANCIQYVEENASGVVTAVAADGASVTITDDWSGQSETFYAYGDNGVEISSRAFNGISVGDHIELEYHQSGGKLVADSVNDDGPSGNSGNGNGNGGGNGNGQTGSTGSTGSSGPTGPTGSTGSTGSH